MARTFTVRGKTYKVVREKKSPGIKKTRIRGKTYYVSKDFGQFQEQETSTQEGDTTNYYEVEHKGQKLIMSEKVAEKFQKAKTDDYVREQLRNTGDNFIVLADEKSEKRSGVFEEIGGKRFNVEGLKVASIKNGQVKYESYQSWRKRNLPDPIETAKEKRLIRILNLSDSDMREIEKPTPLRRDLIDPMNVRLSGMKQGAGKQFAELGAGAVEGVLGISEGIGKFITTPELQEASYTFATTPEAWKYGAAALITEVITEAKESPVRLTGSLIATAGVFKGVSVIGGKIAGRVSPKYTLRLTQEITGSKTYQINKLNVDVTKTATSYEIAETGGVLQRLKIRGPQVKGFITGERAGTVVYSDTSSVGAGSFKATGKLSGKNLGIMGEDFSIASFESTETTVTGMSASVSRSAVKVGRKKGFSDSLSKTEFESKRLGDVGKMEAWETSESSTTLGRSTLGSSELVKGEGKALSVFDDAGKSSFDVKPLGIETQVKTTVTPKTTPKTGSLQESLESSLSKIKGLERPKTGLKPLEDLTKGVTLTTVATKQDITLSQIEGQEQRQRTGQLSSFDSLTKPSSVLETSEAFDSISIQGQIQNQIQIQTLGLGSKQRTTTLTVNVVPTPDLPLGGLLPGGDSGGFGALPSLFFPGDTQKSFKDSDKILGRGTQYKPSLGGIVSGRTVKETPKGPLTGLEVRYPVSKKLKRGLL